MRDIYEGLDTIELEAGTLIHVEGIPFSLAQPTHVLGREANLALVSAKGRKVDSQGSGPDGVK